MSERADIARRLVLQQAVMGRLKTAVDDDRSAAAGMMRPGDAEAVYSPAGEPLGRVRMDAGRTSWRVTDRAALIAWLVEHQPQDVITDLSVRPATERALLKDGGLIDPTTGEIVTPPGISPTPGTPRLVVTSTEHATTLAAEILGAPSFQIEGPTHE